MKNMNNLGIFILGTVVVAVIFFMIQFFGATM